MPDLRSLRHSRGLTIFEVAQRSGLSARALTELEHGLRPFDSAARLALARSYDLAPEVLGAPLAGPVSRSREYQAKRLFQPLIRAALVLALMVIPRFGRTVNRSKSYPSVASERSVVHVDGLEQQWSKRDLLAQTSNSHHGPDTTMPGHMTESALPVVSPTMPPSAIWHPIPGTARRPALAEPFSPAAADVPSPSAGVVSRTNTVFMRLPASGSFHHNVVAALKANDDALLHVAIPPDGVWSFNRAIGDPDRLTLEPINGVYGGGWCDLASRYTMVLRPFLPPESFEFIRHADATGFGLEGVPDEDAVVIWNSNGGGDEQDLRIHNTSGRTISIRAMLVADGVQFEATNQSYYNPTLIDPAAHLE